MAVAKRVPRETAVEQLKTMAIHHQMQLNNVMAAIDELMDATNKLALVQGLEWARDKKQWQKVRKRKASPGR